MRHNCKIIFMHVQYLLKATTTGPRCFSGRICYWRFSKYGINLDKLHCKHYINLPREKETVHTRVHFQDTNSLVSETFSLILDKVIIFSGKG